MRRIIDFLLDLFTFDESKRYARHSVDIRNWEARNDPLPILELTDVVEDEPAPIIVVKAVSVEVWR